eukprot:COSAG01_NODE_20803_length_934_cov_1.471856_1_plen_64_part_00
MQDVATDMLQGAPALPYPVLMGQIVKLRDTLQQLYDFKQQPVPFFYVHVLFLLVSFYLPGEPI